MTEIFSSSTNELGSGADSYAQLRRNNNADSLISSLAERATALGNTRVAAIMRGENAEAEKPTKLEAVASNIIEFLNQPDLLQRSLVLGDEPDPGYLSEVYRLFNVEIARNDAEVVTSSYVNSEVDDGEVTRYETPTAYGTVEELHWQDATGNARYSLLISRHTA